jgi:hypothetical protein
MSEERRRKQMERMAHEAAARFNPKPLRKSSWGIVATAITLVAVFITFYPRPSVAVADEKSRTEPFNVVIALTNNNVIPLRKVRVWLDCHDIETVGGEIKTFEFSSVLWQARALKVNDRRDINLDSAFSVPPAFIERANISVRVEYQPWFIPWTRSKNFPFRVLKQPEGGLRLMAVPEKLT